MDTSLMTMQDVADFLGVSIRYVYRLAKSEGLPVVRIARKMRLKRCDLDAWIDDRRMGQEVTK